MKSTVVKEILDDSIDGIKLKHGTTIGQDSDHPMNEYRGVNASLGGVGSFLSLLNDSWTSEWCEIKRSVLGLDKRPYLLMRDAFDSVSIKLSTYEDSYIVQKLIIGATASFGDFAFQVAGAAKVTGVVTAESLNADTAVIGAGGLTVGASAPNFLQWAFLASMNQSVASGAGVSFASLTITLAALTVSGKTPSAAQWTYLSEMNQPVKAGSNVNFNDISANSLYADGAINATAIATIGGASLGDHETRLGAAESSIGTLQTDMGVAQGDITSLQALEDAETRVPLTVSNVLGAGGIIFTPNAYSHISFKIIGSNFYLARIHLSGTPAGNMDYINIDLSSIIPGIGDHQGGWEVLGLYGFGPSGKGVCICGPAITTPEKTMRLQKFSGQILTTEDPVSFNVQYHSPLSEAYP